MKWSAEKLAPSHCITLRHIGPNCAKFGLKNVHPQNAAENRAELISSRYFISIDSVEDSSSSVSGLNSLSGTADFMISDSNRHWLPTRTSLFYRFVLSVLSCRTTNSCKCSEVYDHTSTRCLELWNWQILISLPPPKRKFCSKCCNEKQRMDWRISADEGPSLNKWSPDLASVSRNNIILCIKRWQSKRCQGKREQYEPDNRSALDMTL